MNLKDINLEELNDMTLVQLKELAKELEIKSISKYKKNELIDTPFYSSKIILCYSSFHTAE